jgi:hypothetical protein
MISIYRLCDVSWDCCWLELLLLSAFSIVSAVGPRRYRSCLLDCLAILPVPSPESRRSNHYRVGRMVYRVFQSPMESCFGLRDFNTLFYTYCVSSLSALQRLPCNCGRPPFCALSRGQRNIFGGSIMINCFGWAPPHCPLGDLRKQGTG